MRYKNYFIVFFIFWFVSNSLWAQTKSNAIKNKANLIFEIGNNVIWPAENKIDTFFIGLFSADKALFDELNILAEQIKIKNKKTIIEFKNKPEFKPKNQIIIINPDFNYLSLSFIKNAIASSVLLITIESFSDENTMINLFQQNSNYYIRINEKNVKASNLKLSSSFLYDIMQNQQVKDSIYQSQTNFHLQKKLKQYEDSMQTLRFLLNNQNVAFSKQELDLLEKQKALEAYSNILYKQKTDFHDQAIQINQQKKLLDQHKIDLKQKQNNQIYTILVSITILIGLIFLLAFIIKKSKIKVLFEQNSKKLEENETELNQVKFEFSHFKHEFAEQETKFNQLNRDFQEISIFAQKTQHSLLTYLSELEFYFDAFNIMMAKDNFSKDVGFFMKQQQSGIFTERFLIAIIDCNYNGIAGTMLSLITYHQLKEVVISHPEYSLSMIINTFHENMSRIIEKNYSNHPIFIDISMASIERQIGEKVSIRYIGAKQNLLIFSRQERQIKIVASENQYIGINASSEKKFKEKLELAQKGDIIYLFSNGILDQRSPKNEKFKQEGLLSLIDKVGVLPVFRQKEIIKSGFQTFMQNKNIDDNVTLLGIRL